MDVDKALVIHKDVIVGNFLVEFVGFHVGTNRFEFEIDHMPQ